MITDIRAIAAVGSNGAIGLNGDLPWTKNKGDLPFFREQTKGGILIAGYKTYQNLPKAVSEDRVVIPFYKAKGPYFNNPSNADSIMQYIYYEYISWPIKPTIWIIGGRQTYIDFASYIKKLVITTIDYDGPYDTTFPFEAFPCFNSKKED